jgi:hypothetical protein
MRWWDRARKNCGDGVRWGRGARLAGREAEEDACGQFLALARAADFESSELIRAGDHWSWHDGAHLGVTNCKTADYDSDICTVSSIVNVWACERFEKEFQCFFRSVPGNFQLVKSPEKFFRFRRILPGYLEPPNILRIFFVKTVTFISSKFHKLISDINHSCPAQQRSTHQSWIRRLALFVKTFHH